MKCFGWLSLIVCLLGVLLMLFPMLTRYFCASDDASQQGTLSCPAEPEANKKPSGEKGDECYSSNQCVTKAEIEDIKQTLRELQRNISKLGQNDCNSNQDIIRAKFMDIKEMLLEMDQNFKDEIAKIKPCRDQGILSRSSTSAEQSTTIRKTSSNATEATTPIASKQVRDCDDVYRNGARIDGVYTIYTGRQFKDVYCEFRRSTPRGRTWMVFQRRINGEVDFYLNWELYVRGFGNTSGEYWLGLQALNEITTSGPYKLRVDLEDWEGNQAYAEYSSFSIGNSSTNYRLNVSGYSGNAGDSMAYHNGQEFTTKDRDNDARLNENNAILWHGAWWYYLGHWSNLNGKYRNHGPGDPTGLDWFEWKSHYSMKHASMKLKRNKLLPKVF